MARKTMNGGGGGGVVLGAVGVVVGIIAVDHYYSRKGHSTFDLLRSGRFFTGFDAPWAELSGKMSTPMQNWVKQVVQKAADSGDAATLQQLAANLAAAGLNQIADAVRQAGQK